MAGLYTHTTRANGTTLTAAIYNADHQNHIDNHIPAQMDDYSSTVAQMQVQTDPGAQGSESQPSSLAGELERLRYALNELKGGTYWYDPQKSNMTATAAPTATEDSSEGYGVGSIWIDVVGDLSYIAVDTTTGAAVWNGLDSGGGGVSIETIEYLRR